MKNTGRQEVPDEFAQERPNDQAGEDDQEGDAEAATSRQGWLRRYDTISGLASVTMRVCSAIALRTYLGSPKACWCVVPSQ